MSSAQDAVRRFLDELLGPQDEVFLMRFDSRVNVLSNWTENRAAVSRMVGSIRPSGGTALYDAVSDAIPLGEQGTRRKKALVLLSDGVVEASRASASDLGPERLATIVRTAGATAHASTILKALQMAVEAGLGSERPADDHTFVVLRRIAKPN